MNNDDSNMAANAICFAADMAKTAWQEAAWEQQRPSVVFKPALSADGTMWCALFGENLQEGVAGFGETPAKAMYAFDQAWLTDKTPAAQRAQGIEAAIAGESQSDRCRMTVLTPSGHAADCEWHCDQNENECTCGLRKRRDARQVADELSRLLRERRVEFAPHYLFNHRHLIHEALEALAAQGTSPGTAKTRNAAEGRSPAGPVGNADAPEGYQP